MATDSSAVFAQVMREPTLSDKVAGSITEAIVSGRLKPGEPLQSERELADQFGVSRTVVREAIRSLAAQGLVASQSGRGMQVTEAGPDAVNRSMSLFLRANASIDYAKVHEIRVALEVEMAGAAAERSGDDELRTLRELLDAMALTREDPERAARLDVEFHLAIAAATGNPLFGVVLGSIDAVLLEARRSAFAAPGMLDYALKAHGEILEALERHDREAAVTAMRAHLELAEDVWTGGTLSSAD